MKMRLSFFFLFLFVLISVLGCDSNYESRQTNVSPGDTIDVYVMLTTDVHGRVRAWDYYNNTPDHNHSLAKVATLVDSIRGLSDYHLLLDAGDWLQGNLFAEYFALHDQNKRIFPYLSAVDHMNYDAIVIGNHEFNYGVDYLDRQLAMTRTPALGANILKHNTEETAYTPYIIKDMGSFRVAVLGLTTPGSAVWDRAHVEGILDFAEGPATVRKYIDHIQNQDLADMIIVAAHSGLEGGSGYDHDEIGDENFGREIGETIPGIHLLALGHTHRISDDIEIIGPDDTFVPVLQSGRWASHLGVAKFTIFFDDSLNARFLSHDITNIPVTEKIDEHPELIKLTEDAHQEVMAFATETLAVTGDTWHTQDSRLQNTGVIDLIHAVQKKATGSQLSAAASFNTQLSFGPGEITRGEIGRLYPYHNTLYKLEINGKQLRSYLEYASRYFDTIAEGDSIPIINRGWPGFNFDMIAGVNYIIDIRKPINSRITLLEYKGIPVQDDDIFTMAVNSYRATGGGTYSMISDAPVLMHIDTSVADMIITYLQEIETISISEVKQNNWKLDY